MQQPIPRESAEHLLLRSAKIRNLLDSGKDCSREQAKFERHARQIFLVSFGFTAKDGHLNNLLAHIGDDEKLVSFSNSLLQARPGILMRALRLFSRNASAGTNCQYDAAHASLVEAFHKTVEHFDGRA